MKILLLGNFGAGNIGDELILSAALEQYPDSIVMTTNSVASQVFCEKNFETVRFFPTGFRSFLQFLFSKKYREELFSLREKVSQVVFAGGGLFAIRFKAYFLWLFVFLWVKKVFPGIPVRFEYQGVDSHLSFLNKKIVQYVFRHTDFISVRDEASSFSVKYCSEKLAQNVGDRVAVLLAQKFPNRNFDKQEVVLVNAVKSFLWNDFVMRFEKRFNEVSKFSFVFVAFEGADLQCVPVGFSGKVVYPQTQTQVFELFQTARMAVGERFHCVLLSEFFCGAQQSFCLRAPYSEKVESFAKEKEVGVL